jgi:hypothetical protein
VRRSMVRTGSGARRQAAGEGARGNPGVVRVGGLLEDQAAQGPSETLPVPGGFRGQALLDRTQDACSQVRRNSRQVFLQDLLAVNDDIGRRHGLPGPEAPFDLLMGDQGSRSASTPLHQSLQGSVLSQLQCLVYQPLHHLRKRQALLRARLRMAM